MKRIIKKIHLWLSLPFGLIIAITCFSGAMLVFEDEITEFSSSHLYKVNPTGTQEPLSIDHLLSLVEESLPEDVSIIGVTIAAGDNRSYLVNLSKPRRASLFVNPYTGEVLGNKERIPFFMTMFRLHRWLMDSPSSNGRVFWGRVIVGISTIMFVIVLLTGLINGWPRMRKKVKNRFKIHLNRGWRRFNYDLHVLGGFYAVILLLSMSLTGLTWSFSWYSSAFNSLFGVETQTREGHHANRSAQSVSNSTESAFEVWPMVYETIAAENPAYKQIRITPQSATVSFDRWGNVRASDTYNFDTNSGEIESIEHYKEKEKASKIRGWIYSVHTGSWGGWVSKTLSFLVALLGASLPLSGYYLWWKRLSSKSRRKKKTIRK